ncbi:hypothetical protein [Tardiphaga sp. 841_E9_N1_2]|uniref:hypothetical protein n=1 Tax=Tardiphaga sp. 841_E9_N1_2 TaxID=3240762 RepID=UPI003F1F8E5A
MKMSQVHADMERFVQPLPLDEYRTEVSENLQFVEHGASMICRRVAMLDRRPGFRTMAQDDLDQAELVLEQSLAKIRAAKVAFEQKPMERSNAG